MKITDVVNVEVKLTKYPRPYGETDDDWNECGDFTYAILAGDMYQILPDCATGIFLNTHAHMHGLRRKPTEPDSELRERVLLKMRDTILAAGRNCNGCPSAGTCQPESKSAPESDEMFEQPDAACEDCLHFDYVKMDPYCKLKGQVVEHDFHCRDFAIPLPKIADPED